MTYSRRSLTIKALALLAAACAAAPRADSAPAAAPGQWDLIVAPGGNDAWSGRLAEPNAAGSDGPLATLDAARLAVRKLRAAEPAKEIRVALRGGTYRLDATVEFSLEDSSGEHGRTVYAALPGETPVLSSGVAVGGWEKLKATPDNVPSAAKSHLWTAAAPAALKRVLTLYDGLNRLPRARSAGFKPPHGWQDDGAGRGPCDVFYFPEGIVQRYRDFAGADLLVMPTANYEMCILPIDYVDRSSQMGVTRQFASRAMGPMQFHPETMWIENRLEDLDQPGEWVFDAATRRLYLWPVGDEPGANIVAPGLIELVRVEGAVNYAGPKDEPTRNITFRGLTFAHGQRPTRQGQDGWDLQHQWEKFDRPSGLVRFRGAEGCVVEACRLTASGGSGVRMDLHCQRNAVRDCELSHLGGVGVLLAGYGPGTKDVNVENEVANNWIHHIGELYWASPAVFAWQSGRNVIANNLIHNTPYTGIAVSGRIAWMRGSVGASSKTVRWQEIKEAHPFPWSWEEREPYLHSRLNHVERNDIHDVMERLGDGNGIYVSGAGKGNRISENFIHHCDSDYLVQAIRCDDDQFETVIEKNVIYKVRSMHEAVAVKGKNDVCNNFFIDLIPSRLPIDPRWRMKGYIGLQVNPVVGAKIQRNIIYSSDPSYTPYIENRSYGQGGEPRLRDCEADYNLYFSPNDLQWGAAHLTKEREFGIEAHSRIADPLFVDVEHGDFRLSEKSPALALGIQPIDMTRIGLRRNHPFKTDKP